jgi:hypothetical protein
MVSGVGMRLRLRVVLLQCLGLPVLAGLGVLWLQIPDSHAWELGLSIVSGAGIVLGFLWVEVGVVQGLRLAVDAGRILWRGMGLMAVWLGLWYGLAVWVMGWRMMVVERAGFWNSRLSSHGRTVITFPRLVAWQNDAIGFVLWVLLPGLLLPLIVETVSRGVGGGVWRGVGRVYLGWRLWVAAGLAAVLLVWPLDWLLDWHPAFSVKGELVSAGLRLGGVYVLVVGVGLVLLAVVAELLGRAAVRVTGDDEASVDQPG